MSKFIISYDENDKSKYQYVYGTTYNEFDHKVLISCEVKSHYRYITVGKVYEEWLNAVMNRVKESTF